MIVGEYIKESCGYWGIPYSDSLYYSLAGDIDEHEIMTDEILEGIEVRLFHHIPMLLSGVKSVNESGFSVTLNVDGLKDLYSYLYQKYSDKYDLTDKYGILNTITDVTDAW